MTSAERQRRFRVSMAEAGFVQCNVWVPAVAVPSIQRAAELLREGRADEVARLVQSGTGRLVGLKRGGKG